MRREGFVDIVDIENNYFEKNGLIEDMIEEIMIEFEDNDSNDDSVDEDDMIDKNDRQLIFKAL